MSRTSINLKGFYPKELQITETIETPDKTIIKLKSHTHTFKCPSCKTILTHYNSTYLRRVQDLPMNVQTWVPTVRHSKKSDDFNENPDPDFFSQKRLLLYRDIHRLHEAGYSMRGISRKLKCSRNTVIKYLNGEMENICTPTLFSGVDRYRDYIISHCPKAYAGAIYSAVWGNKDLFAAIPLPMTTWISSHRIMG